jgi:hypothetical protein
MDLINRDLLQVGQGLPSGRVIDIPSGVGALAVRRPGPPGSNLTWPIGTTEISAVTPGPGLGPIVNGVASDITTTLAVDSAFERVSVTQVLNGQITIANAPAPGVNITDGGADDIFPGDLIMLTKGTNTTLVQATAVAGQTITFAANDSLDLNQAAAADGTLIRLRNAAPPNLPTGNENVNSVAAYRILMITYYIDAATDPARPRLVRRIGNGDPLVFDNNRGTTVAFDVEGLTISYDLVNGVNNPANVRMTAADLAGGGGACAPNDCSPNNIRKMNVVLAGRSRQAARNVGTFFRNTLTSQVSLRSLAFVDRYR